MLGQQLGRILGHVQVVLALLLASLIAIRQRDRAGRLAGVRLDAHLPLGITKVAICDLGVPRFRELLGICRPHTRQFARTPRPKLLQRGNRRIRKKSYAKLRKV